MCPGEQVVISPPAPPGPISVDGCCSANDVALGEVRDSLRGLQFGSVNIIVQDGRVIQIDRTEKRRLPTGRRAPNL